MKKQILAVGLSAVLALGGSVMAFAESTEHDTHGSEEAAVVSDSTSSENSTQFYVYVDKDASSDAEGGVTTEQDQEVTPDASSDEAKYIHHYLITYEYTRTTNINTTVPLYVCMYGYGATGDVVTPSESSYTITNNSSYSQVATVSGIYACYSVTKVTTENADDYADICTNTSGNYGVYYTGYSNNQLTGGTKVLLSACSTDSSGNYYYKDSEGLTSGSVTDSELGVTWTYSDSKWKTGDSASYTTVNSTLAVKIPTITATNSWELVSTSESSLSAGEIQMTLSVVNEDESTSKVDLSNAVGGLDITSEKWVVEAGDDNALAISVYARIAGDSVNESGCMEVATVTYKISPYYSSASNTTVSEESTTENTTTNGGYYTKDHTGGSSN